MWQVTCTPRILTIMGEHESPRESLAGGCLLTVTACVEPRALLRPLGERDGRAACPHGEASTANQVGRHERQESR